MFNQNGAEKNLRHLSIDGKHVMNQSQNKNDDTNQKSLAILAFNNFGVASMEGNHPHRYPHKTGFLEVFHHLHDQGWTVIDLETLIGRYQNPLGLPNKSAILTFDDASRSMVTVILPSLLMFGYSGVVFVPAAIIGKVNWFGDRGDLDEEICTWRDLRLLEENGLSVQSRGFSRRRFWDLNPVEQFEELLFSKNLLEARLEKRVDAFAYPYVEPGEDLNSSIHLVFKAGYRASFFYGRNLTRLPITEPFQLTRVEIGPGTRISQIL